jgi:hypothetical protein
MATPTICGPANLLGLPRRARSFGRKGSRAVAKSRDGRSLFSAAALTGMVGAINAANARPNDQEVTNVNPILRIA